MSAERPTLKDVYELVDKKLEKVPTKTEMRLTVVLAVVTGTGVGAIFGHSPVEQIQTGAHFLSQLL